MVLALAMGYGLWVMGIKYLSVMKDSETEHPKPKLKAKDRYVKMEYVSAYHHHCMNDGNS